MDMGYETEQEFIDSIDEKTKETDQDCAALIEKIDENWKILGYYDVSKDEWLQIHLSRYAHANNFFYEFIAFLEESGFKEFAIFNEYVADVVFNYDMVCDIFSKENGLDIFEYFCETNVNFCEPNSSLEELKEKYQAS